jgi:hypothetical protein
LAKPEVPGFESSQDPKTIVYGTNFLAEQPSCLGYHLKTGHTLSVQNRPTGLAEDVIVLPCRSVRLQGLGLSPRSGV